MGMATTAFAAEPSIDQSAFLTNHDKVIQYQLDGFAELKAQAQNMPMTRAATYPTRKGVILVTDDGSFGELVGHAGIIYSSTETVESFPDGGVALYDNDWDTRYTTVYGATVVGTTSTEDSLASDDAEGRIGKPYNWIFTDVNRVDQFYCSQLVYRAFLDVASINLNQGGWICFPIDLIQSKSTNTIYTQ